jgi:CO/xanthine dehydrogenase Mo-binding subunit
LLKTLEAIEPIYQERRKVLATQPEDGLKRGLGIACLGYGIGYSGVRNPSTARMRVTADGLVTAFCGTPDIGTGSDMSLAQIAAQSSGVGLRRIRVVSGDSTKTDDSGPTSASRTTYFSGNAAYICGQDFKRQFEEAVARARSMNAAQVRIEDDEIVIGNERLRFEEACRLIAKGIDDICGYGKFDPEIEASILTFKGNPYPTYVYATHLVEVAVDEELGRVDVLRCWAAHDAGTIINPVGAEGQVDGGVAMGIGQALWEKVQRRDGVILNPHYRDYLMPGAKDVPLEIKSIFIQNHDRTGPYGAKGLAEVSLIPIPAAIAAALHDAVGIRPKRLPMSAEYLLGLINERASAAAANCKAAVGGVHD